MQSSYGSYVLETFVTLLLVCVVAVVVLYGARRFGIGRARGPIELVGQLPLDARRAIYLVRVGAQVIVVGASEAGLSRLGEVAENALPKEDKPNGTSFKDVLAKLRGSPAITESLTIPEPEEPGVAPAKDPDGMNMSVSPQGEAHVHTDQPKGGKV
jgi:flagellar biogenesis protein FliO